MPRRRFLFGLGIVLLVFIFVYGGAAFNTFLLYNDVREVAEIMDIVKNEYVDPIDPQRCQEKILQSGLNACLDANSHYWPRRDAPDAETIAQMIQGSYGGIGVEVDKREDDFVRVISPIEGSPASKAGIMSGDIILSIHGVSTRQMSLYEFAKNAMGKVNTEVILTIKRGNEKPSDIVLIRERIIMKPVKAYLVTPEIGYARISSFTEKIDLDFLSVVAKLDGESDGRLPGLILDLRNNPGGVLGAVVKNLEQFAPEAGRIMVSVKGLHNDPESSVTKEKGVFADLKIAVLVNGGSASASEIMAGVLQIWGHPVIGEDSYKKGTVQAFPIKLSSGGILSLTVARYFLGEKEIKVDGVGITPDYEVIWKKKDGQSGNEFAEEYRKNFGDSEKDPQLKKTIEVVQKDISASRKSHAIIMVK